MSGKSEILKGYFASVSETDGVHFSTGAWNSRQALIVQIRSSSIDWKVE